MNCPLCLWDEWETFPGKHVSRRYVACQHCGKDVVRLDPLISFEESLGIYGKSYFEEMQGTMDPGRAADFADYGLLDFESFVEFGPGGDQVLKWLRGFGKYVEGVDVNPATIERLRSQGIPAHMTPLELDRDLFDVALSYHYLEHIRNPRLELRYQAAIAKRIFLHVPVGLDELGNRDHNWLISAEALAKIAERFGTILRSDIRIYPAGSALQLLIEVRR